MKKIKESEKNSKLNGEELKEEIKNELPNKKENTEKKKFTIMGFTIWRIIIYFIIYSILGYIAETLFGLITKGVLESRKNFLYGPFCCIYGVGALVVILGLQKFKKNNYTIFFGGVLIGSIVEYFISLVGEFIFHMKWWDYSSMPFNINGRICLAFSVLWGIMAIYLMCHLHPVIDKVVARFSDRTVKVVAIYTVIFMFFSFVITSFALEMFFARLIQDYNLDLKDMDNYVIKATDVYNNPTVKKISDKLFTNERMIKTFPNIKVTLKSGEVIHVREILSDIKPYYIRVFTPKINVDDVKNIVKLNSD